MYYTLSVIKYHCKISSVLLNKVCISTCSTYPGTPNSVLNSKFVYRRGYPEGGQCTAERDSSADPMSPCSTQETNLTVNNTFFRKIIKGTSHPLRQSQLPSLLHPEGTTEGDQPGLGSRSATVRIISAVVIIHRRG